YDSVTTEFLWSLIMKHIPALKNDVENILTNK
ncbi:antitoxin, partial [Bacteroides cellulosilyticus]